MKSRYVLILAVSILLLCVIGCAAGSNPSLNLPAADGSVAGFWLGLWHGIIAPIAFIVSLFTENIHFYEVHNNGWPYNIGFVLGFSCVSGGGGGAACRKRKHRRH